jgi:hypothetical protein
MPVARASRYPQPPAVTDVLTAERCDHGEITGRCALCRLATESSRDPATAPGTAEQPEPAVAPVRICDSCPVAESCTAFGRCPLETQRSATPDR